MSEELLSTVVIAGRVLLGGAFAFAGARNIFNAPFLANMMAGRGVPLAKAALYVGIVLQIAAGVLFALGILVPYAVAALIVFLVVATWIFHNFWDHQGPDRAARVNGVISNVAFDWQFPDGPWVADQFEFRFGRFADAPDRAVNGWFATENRHVLS